MNYEHEWATEARKEVCRLPVLDGDELRLFEWHVDETETFINEMRKKEKTATAAEVDAGDECAGSGWIAVDYFVKRIRYGQINYLVSLVETFLTKACERLKVAVGEQSILFGLDELSGDKFPKRRKFLKRYGQISVPADRWAAIETMVSIRNICIHENGCVNASGKKRRAWPKGVIVDQGELVLDASYINGCLEGVRGLADHVENELRQVAARSFQPRAVQQGRRS